MDGNSSARMFIPAALTTPKVSLSQSTHRSEPDSGSMRPNSSSRPRTVRVRRFPDNRIQLISCHPGLVCRRTVTGDPPPAEGPVRRGRRSPRAPRFPWSARRHGPCPLPFPGAAQPGLDAAGSVRPVGARERLRIKQRRHAARGRAAPAARRDHRGAEPRLRTRVPGQRGGQPPVAQVPVLVQRQRPAVDGDREATPGIVEADPAAGLQPEAQPRRLRVGRREPLGGVLRRPGRKRVRAPADIRPAEGVDPGRRARRRHGPPSAKAASVHERTSSTRPSPLMLLTTSTVFSLREECGRRH